MQLKVLNVQEHKIDPRMQDHIEIQIRIQKRINSARSSGDTEKADFWQEILDHDFN